MAGKKEVIKEYILDAIRKKQLNPGEKLFSRHVFMERFSCARATVDKAIADAIAHIDAKRAELKLEPYDPNRYAKSDTYYPVDYAADDVFDENRYTRAGT